MAEYVMSLAREIGSRLDTKRDRLTDAIITGDIGQFECCDYSFTCSDVVRIGSTLLYLFYGFANK